MTENTPRDTPDQHVAAISKERLLLLTGIIVLGVILAYFYTSSNSTNNALRQQNIQLKKNVENTKALLAELQQAKLQRIQEQAANKTIVDQRLSELDDAEQKLQDLRSEIKTYLSTEADLHNGPLGRRIATNPDALRQYRALAPDTKPDALLPDKLKARLDVLRQPLLQSVAANTKSFKLAPMFEQTLHDIQVQISDTLVEVRTRNAQLQAIIAQAPSTPAPDALSLDAALEKLEQEETIKQNKRVVEEVAKVREEFTRKLAEQIAETERLKKQLDLEIDKRKRELALQEKQQAIQDLATKEQIGKKQHEMKAAREKLLRDFAHDLSEIKSLLKPFITPGRFQPNGHILQLSTKTEPISLSKLNGAGVLAPTVLAQQKLWGLISANRADERPLGAFPPYVGGYQNWVNTQQTIARAQELLIKYGELMVEKGMLAP